MAPIDFNQRNKKGDTPLMLAVKSSSDKTSPVAIVGYLIDKGAEINAQDENGETALIKAVRVRSPNLELIEYLLSRGANRTIVDHDDKTARDRAYEILDDELRGKLVKLLKPTGITK